jgi:Fe-S cluster biogenesis protein NfuA
LLSRANPRLISREFGRRNVHVLQEQTPNEHAMMFSPKDRQVLGEGAKMMEFRDKHLCRDSDLAKMIFKVRGVTAVSLGPDHVTVTKDASLDWNFLVPNVELAISQFFELGLTPARPEAIQFLEDDDDGEEAESTEARIQQLFNHRIRPFVQKDGGDVEVVEWDATTKILTVQLKGACVGCSKSSITLKQGIKGMVQHYVPEVEDVVNVDDDSDDDDDDDDD